MTSDAQIKTKILIICMSNFLYELTVEGLFLRASR